MIPASVWFLSSMITLFVINKLTDKDSSFPATPENQVKIIFLIILFVLFVTLTAGSLHKQYQPEPEIEKHEVLLT